MLFVLALCSSGAQREERKRLGWWGGEVGGRG